MIRCNVETKTFDRTVDDGTKYARLIVRRGHYELFDLIQLSL